MFALQKFPKGNGSQNYFIRKKFIWKFVSDVKAVALNGNSPHTGFLAEMCNVFKSAGFTTVFWYFWWRDPGSISIKGEYTLPKIISIYHLSPWPAESRESFCKQTGEIEHRHSTFEPHVYHRLYILHWLCLKISLHIQTTVAVAVCAWTESVCMRGKI